MSRIEKGVGVHPVTLKDGAFCAILEKFFTEITGLAVGMSGRRAMGHRRSADTALLPQRLQTDP